jgi:hypothetical protein
MARIYYTATGYTGQFTNVNTAQEVVLNCKKTDLYRCAITVGNPGWLSRDDIRRFGLGRAFIEAIGQKALIVYSNIFRQGPNLCLHPIFANHISDDKRKVSYSLGMAVAKFYAEKLLDIPNLIHIETLKKQGAVGFINLNARHQEPDLVGQTSDGNWHIFEAKGMSDNKLASKVLEAKTQAQQVATIHGAAPVTLSACATYFSDRRILSRIEDPISEQKKEISIEADKYYDAYYNPFLAAESLPNQRVKKKRIEGSSFNFWTIERGNISLNIGLDEEVFDLLRQKNYDRLPDYYAKSKRKSIVTSDNQNISVGIDGFFVQIKR